MSSTSQPAAVISPMPMTSPKRTSSIVPGRSAGTRVTTILVILKTPERRRPPMVRARQPRTRTPSRAIDMSEKMSEKRGNRTITPLRPAGVRFPRYRSTAPNIAEIAENKN
jgi:hypothetical protein